MGKDSANKGAGTAGIEAITPKAADTIAMVRNGDTGPNAVVAQVRPEDVAAARADGWVEKG